MKLRQKRFVKTTEKYGIELPRNADHAKVLDERNGNTLWQDTIAKEMKNVRVAFDILPLLRANTSTQLPLDRLQHYLICRILLKLK